MRKLLAFIAIAMACICANAATPSYENFDPAYFTRSGNTLRVNITNISGPTNGITSSTATNIAAYQAQIATNKQNTDLTSLINSTSNSITAATTNFVNGRINTTSNGLYSLIGSWNGAVTNNDVRDDLNLPYVDIGLPSVRNTNAIYLTGYLGGSTNTTLYRKTHLVYTNATSGLVFWNGSAISTSGDLVITNAAHNNLSADYAATAIRLGTFPAELPTIAWEDTIGNTLSMQAQWTLGTNSIYATTISADIWNPGRASFFGADVPSIADGNGFALDGSGIKISINTNSENYKVGLSIVNKYANLTEINIENQDGSGNRKGQLVMGPAANGTAFLGSPGLFRIIDPTSAFPHTDLFTINRTNGVTTVTNPLIGGTLTGNISGATNASPSLATNNATATDGMALVKRGNNLKLETITGSGSGTFDYAALTNLPTPILLLATNQGSSLSNAFAIAAGDSSVTLVTNANGRLVTITATGGGGGGSPTTISNNYFVAASSTATYTNSTAYWLYVSTELYQSAAVVSLAKSQFMVDTNVNGTLDKFREYWWQIGDDNVHYQSSGWVPPGASYQWTNTFGNMALFNFAIQQTYLIEGSGGGSGTGIATNGGSGTGNTFSNANLITTTATTNYMTINGTGTARSAFVIDGNLSQRFRMMEAYYDANTALFGVVFPNGLTAEGDIVANRYTGDGSLLTLLNGSAVATGTLNRPVTNSAVKTGDLVVTNNLSVAGNIDVAGTFNVGTVNSTNFFINSQSNGVAVVQSDGSVIATNSVTLSSANSVLFVTNTASGTWLRYSNGSLTIGPTNAAAGVTLTSAGAVAGASLTGSSIISAGHLQSGAGSRHDFNGRSALGAPASGMISMFNLTDFQNFERLMLGAGTSTSTATNYPALMVLTTNNVSAGSVLAFMNGTNRVSGVASGYTRTVDILSGGHEVATNSAPQAAAWSNGGMYIWNSNGSGLYLLRSGPNSTTWTSTNVLLAP